MTVEPQNRTQFSVDGTKGAKIRKVHMSLHLGGHMQVDQREMQTSDVIKWH